MSTKKTTRPAGSIDEARRKALMGMTACAAGGLGAGRLMAQAAECVLTPDAGEGPFYFDPERVRADIVDRMPGAPLAIALRVVRSTDCSALAGARVDVWHADGIGLYSGYRQQPGVGLSTEPAVGKQYLRGTQFSDADGRVRFRTIFPSWYGGRTPHVHFKVIVDGEELLASQVFFPDEVSRDVFSRWDPYREHASKRTVFNTNDRLFDGVLSVVDRNDEDGVSASADVAVTV